MKKLKLVVCVDSSKPQDLQFGKVYEVIGEHKDSYLIKETKNWHDKDRFKDWCEEIDEDVDYEPTKEVNAVNHPDHYNKGIEAIDYIESWGMNFNMGNAIKYITRAPFKNDMIEDLKKALWYIEREIKRLENK